MDTLLRILAVLLLVWLVGFVISGIYYAITGPASLKGLKRVSRAAAWPWLAFKAIRDGLRSSGTGLLTPNRVLLAIEAKPLIAIDDLGVFEPYRESMTVRRFMNELLVNIYYLAGTSGGGRPEEILHLEAPMLGEGGHVITFEDGQIRCWQALGFPQDLSQILPEYKAAVLKILDMVRQATGVGAEQSPS